MIIGVWPKQSVLKLQYRIRLRAGRVHTQAVPFGPRAPRCEMAAKDRPACLVVTKAGKWLCVLRVLFQKWEITDDCFGASEWDSASRLGKGATRDRRRSCVPNLYSSPSRTGYDTGEAPVTIIHCRTRRWGFRCLHVQADLLTTGAPRDRPATCKEKQRCASASEGPRRWNEEPSLGLPAVPVASEASRPPWQKRRWETPRYTQAVVASLQAGRKSESAAVSWEALCGTWRLVFEAHEREQSWQTGRTRGCRLEACGRRMASRSQIHAGTSSNAYNLTRVSRPHPTCHETVVVAVRGCLRPDDLHLGLGTATHGGWP